MTVGQVTIDEQHSEPWKPGVSHPADQLVLGFEEHEVQYTNGLVVCGVEGSEGRTKGTLHLLIHHVILIIGLEHC